MTTIETVSLLSSFASLILAIVAIWLSFKFFEKSTEASEKTNEASKGIITSVVKLENLFDKLYSDTFSMMKDTVSDMRKHIWNNDDKPDTKESNLEVESEKKAQEKVEALKRDLSEDLSKMLAKQHNTDNEITNLKSELSTLIESAVSQTRTLEMEAREETTRKFLLNEMRFFKRRKNKIMSRDIVNNGIRHGLKLRPLLEELFRMKVDGLIDFEGDEVAGPDEEIFLK
jgi:hypothetical protein